MTTHSIWGAGLLAALIFAITPTKTNASDDFIYPQNKVLQNSQTTDTQYPQDNTNAQYHQDVTNYSNDSSYVMPQNYHGQYYNQENNAIGYYGTSKSTDAHGNQPKGYYYYYF